MEKRLAVDVEALKAFLAGRGIMQTWLARQIGVTQNTMTLSMNKKRSLKATEYLSICAVLGVPFSQFVVETPGGKS